MSFPPVSSGIMHPYYPPHVQLPLPPQQQELFPDESLQPNLWDAQINDHGRHLSDPGLFEHDNAPAFPAPASNVPHGPVQVPNVNASLPLFPAEDPPPLDVVWPATTLIRRPDDAREQASANRALQAPCTCVLCSAAVTQPAFWPAQVDGERRVPAGRDAAAASSSSRRDPAAVSRLPSAPPAPAPFPVVAGAGPVGRAAIPRIGHARTSRRVSAPVRSGLRGRRDARTHPLVRVEDRIEWVRRDLMKMTLWFNWSPDAEAEAHERWG
ncbi:hypothetical protein F5148DRAFT_193415 [Russula earlei]|uniref:Uncharacterized protein n=1 Tax=Russula earlei TaxID=71964 RepID=A0ACC0U4Y7_9AGAM|nr:hypothetical protein F5148DRAFT_193415 [Russula earlei]